MKLIELRATKENIDVKAGGVITYSTEIVSEPGIILLDNPKGEYSLALLSTYHPGGKVEVVMRGVGSSGNKKYSVGDVVAKLAVF